MKWFKWLLSIVLAAVVLRMLWPMLADYRTVAGLFRTAHWGWLPVILAVAVVSYLSLTWLNLTCLRPFPGRVGWGHMTGSLTAVAFIEVALPSAGVSGFALRARLLGLYGYSLEASSFSFILESIFLLIAMTSVGVFGIVHLLRTGEVSNLQLLKLGGLAFGVAVAVWMAWRLINDFDRSRRLVVWFARRWNRWFARWQPIDLPETEQRLHEFQDHLALLKDIPQWRFFAAAYGRVMLDVASFGLCFHLFGQSVGIGQLFTGYSLMLLMSALAALPGGTVTADMATALVFAKLGVEQSHALAASLIYRLVAFWLMRLCGFVYWQVMEACISRAQATAGEPALDERLEA